MMENCQGESMGILPLFIKSFFIEFLCSWGQTAMENNFDRKKLMTFILNTGDLGRSIGTSKRGHPDYYIVLTLIFWPMVAHN